MYCRTLWSLELALSALPPRYFDAVLFDPKKHPVHALDIYAAGVLSREIFWISLYFFVEAFAFVDPPQAVDFGFFPVVH